ncbi:hypothetical protein [Synoicihabitans lomoniglobus]|uniref:DoxX family protein n=1 Tax=Synoicihabitans lomoniglobus TaxID=2909285 RepID=A0AAF0A1S7_9BACT|nr:hypothetical protein [Opitutaceae bacterium LMO-M01]WED65302.1 hypothetical protein PXH66_00380 [Opitutaceae bacterium LMO-M01]
MFATAAPSPGATVRTLPTTLAWVLRIATAGCFIGHGAFGVITKAGWLPYFGVAAIPEPIAWQLMPWVGTMDILMGITMLFLPLRALAMWCVVWAVWTASLRPLSGESVWELFERAGNFGAPLALLALAGWRGRWWTTLQPRSENIATTAMVLRLATATLLIGHAGCNLFDAKPAFLGLYQVILPSANGSALVAVGLFEFALAAAVLLRPSAHLLFFVCAWKLGTEILWPFAGSPFWEFIERFGSYGVPLALALLLSRTRP